MELLFEILFTLVIAFSIGADYWPYFYLFERMKPIRVAKLKSSSLLLRVKTNDRTLSVSSAKLTNYKIIYWKINADKFFSSTKSANSPVKDDIINKRRL